jgi:hypothetical protein
MERRHKILDTFLIVLLVVLGVPFGAVALFMAADAYHVGWTEVRIHYRLSFGVEVGGVAYTGQTVVQVHYEKVPRWQAWAWIDAPPGGATYRGQAAVLQLPDHRVLFLMTSGETLVARQSHPIQIISRQLLGPVDRSRGTRGPINAENAKLVSGVAEIPLGLVPTILLLDDSSNPKSAHVFDPEQPEEWLGRGAKFLGAQIAVTTEPLTSGIANIFPWLSAGGEQRLTDSRDPFFQESGQNFLYKAYFY